MIKSIGNLVQFYPTTLAGEDDLDLASACVALAEMYSVCASKYAALCDVNYLKTEMEHYTTGDYAGSGTPSELALLAAATVAELQGADHILITCYDSNN